MNLYASSIRVCFLLFESMRMHLKFQLEVNYVKIQQTLCALSIDCHLK